MAFHERESFMAVPSASVLRGVGRRPLDFSYDVCLILSSSWTHFVGMSLSRSEAPERSCRSGGGLAPRSRCVSIRQHEIGKVFKHPAVFEGSINDPQEFPGQGDDRLSRAPPSFDLFVVALQIW